MDVVLGTTPPSALHVFTRNGRSLLFDAATRSSFELDAASGMARLLPGLDLAETVIAASTENGADPMPPFQDLAELQASGYFQHRLLARPPPTERRAYSVCVILSRRCNLRCRYCYTRQARRSASQDMPTAVMEAAARFAAQLEKGSLLDGGGVDVSCAGEITCGLDLYDRFAELLDAEGDRLGVRLAPCIWFGVNLTTLCRPEVAARLAALGILSCSLDGPREAHDRMRVYPDGRGTYADAKRGLKQLRALGNPFQASAVLTAAYPNALAVYRHLFELGCDSVTVKPVRAEPGQPYAIGEDLEAVCRGYDRFAEWLLTLPDPELLTCLRAILQLPLSHDYFGRFLQRVMTRSVVQRRCGAWDSELTVNTDGSLYSCPAMAGLPEARIGSLQEGVDEAWMQEMGRRLHVSSRRPCNSCWARYVCGGACPHQSWLTHGDFFTPDPAECALNRHLIELAIWLYSQLRDKRLSVLAAIPALAMHGSG